jgi:hypothetical protein
MVERKTAGWMLEVPLKISILSSVMFNTAPDSCLTVPVSAAVRPFEVPVSYYECQLQRAIDARNACFTGRKFGFPQPNLSV